MDNQAFVARLPPLKIAASTDVAHGDVPRPTTQFKTVLVTNTSPSTALFGYVAHGGEMHDFPPAWPVLAGKSRLFAHAENGAHVAVVLTEGSGDVYVEFGDGVFH